MAERIKLTALWLTVVCTVFLSGSAWGYHQFAVWENKTAISSVQNDLSCLTSRMSANDVSVGQLSVMLKTQSELLQEVRSDLKQILNNGGTVWRSKNANAAL